MIRDIVTPAAVVVEAEADADVQYRAIQNNITKADGDSITERLKFGRRMNVERDRNGGKQLPHGRLAEVCAKVGISQTEARDRMQAAAQFQTTEEVNNAVATFGSWRAIRDQLGRRSTLHEVSVERDVEVVVLPDDFPTIDDVPWPGPIHPYCAHFPIGSWVELQMWANDMRDIGLIEPVIIAPDGTLLDGKNRLIACKLAGIEARFSVYERDDHESFIYRSNVLRKHGESDLDALEDRIRDGLDGVRDACASLTPEMASKLIVTSKPLIEQMASGTINRDDPTLKLLVPSFVLASAEHMPDDVFQVSLKLVLTAALEGLATAGAR